MLNWHEFQHRADTLARSLNIGLFANAAIDRGKMGTLREQGTPFIGARTSFASAYPNVESAIVHYTETDFGDDPRAHMHDLGDGPRVACGNRLCNRGGYNFEWQLDMMVSDGSESSVVKMSCQGDEGTPKGRRHGKDCLMSIIGTMTVKYKKSEKVPNQAAD